ncbi:MAG: response regulator [Acidobacteriota bacterium]
MRLEIEPNVATLDFSETQAAARPAHGPDVDAEKNLKQAIAAAQSGDRNNARVLLFRVTEAEPQNVDAWLWLASISEYPEELLGFLVKVLEIDPGNQRARQWEKSTRSLLAKTFVQRGVTAFSDGQTEFAAECFDDALESDLSCSAAWLWKATVSESVEEKELCLARVLDLEPENEGAQAAMRQLSETRTAAKLDAVRTAAFADDLEAAEDELDNILNAEPANVDAWKLRSQIAESFAEKLEAYQKASELDPEDVFARCGYEYLLNEQSLATAAVTPVLEASHGEESQTVNHTELDAPQPQYYPLHAVEPVFHMESTQDAVVETVFTDFPATFDMPAPLNTEDQDGAGEDDPTEQDHFDAEDNFDINAEFAAFQPPLEEPEQANVSYDTSYATEQFVDLSEPLPDHEATSFVPAETETAADETDLSSYAPAESFEGETDTVATFQRELPAASTAECVPCAFCGGDNEPQVFSCNSCRAVLSLSDTEALFNGTNADRETIQDAVTQMEAEWNLREFNEAELTTLGLGHFNLNNYEQGIAYFHEASRLNPNNVVFAGQVNAFAIRLNELQRQMETREALPKGKTILVVDDSATVRKLISSKLEKSGHNVLTAVDGVEAMEVIEKHVPDLVLLDIAMPRMDGYSVCKLIRANAAVKNVPVVMISGKDGFFDKVRGRMAGTTGYITKPFGPETLMRALETYLVPDELVD